MSTLTEGICPICKVQIATKIQDHIKACADHRSAETLPAPPPVSDSEFPVADGEYPPMDLHYKTRQNRE